MVRLTHLSGSLMGSTSTSPKAIIRIGRGADCDVRFDARMDTRVSTHHAEIRFEDGHYILLDVGSSNGTLVNGKRVAKHKLRSGDTFTLGAGGGPEVKFEIEKDAASMGRSNGGGMAVSPYGAPPASPYGAPPASPYGAPPVARKPAPNTDKDANQLAAEAQQKISMARAMSGAANSGQTAFILVDTLKQVEEVTKVKSSKKWVKVVLGVMAVGAVIVAAMGAVIWEQQRQIAKIGAKKQSADKEIAKIQQAMDAEADPDKLAMLEERLKMLTGQAQEAIGEMEKKDKKKAEALSEHGDELDREIRKILKKFEADTYAIPLNFKERLKHHIDKTLSRSNTKQVYKLKKQYWPIIVKEFAALGLPEEIAYVAWAESQFDPFIESHVGARGMWQFMPYTARDYGMRVDDKVDERTDVAKSTRAAARYLANLLADFGADSFMIAIASYNKGEAGMRKVLRQVAQQPGGWRKDKRDFWHLYRLKLLPEETMEYVPQILAAAIICANPKKYGLE